MRRTLFVQVRLHAQHSLEEREAPHDHIWCVDVGVEGPYRDGKVVSMPLLHGLLEAEIEPLQGAFLNECELVPESVRLAPTCETLGDFLWERINYLLKVSHELAHLTLVKIKVEVEEIDGKSSGWIELSS